jgi:hypothetical protein
MSEVNALDSALINLKNNKFDVTELTPDEVENLQKFAPVLLEACINLAHVGAKVQEKVLSTIDKAIEIYGEQLKDPNLSQEARDKLNDRIERMVELSFKKDSEYKKWALYLAYAGVSGAALYLAGKNPKVREFALNALKGGD